MSTNVHAVMNKTGGLIDSGANTSLQGANMCMLHQEHGSVAVVGPSDGGVKSGMDNLALATCGGVAQNSFGKEVRTTSCCNLCCILWKREVNYFQVSNGTLWL